MVSLMLCQSPCRGVLPLAVPCISLHQPYSLSAAGVISRETMCILAVSKSHPISNLVELKGHALVVNLAHGFQFLTTELKKKV